MISYDLTGGAVPRGVTARLAEIGGRRAARVELPDESHPPGADLASTTSTSPGSAAHSSATANARTAARLVG